MWWGTKQDFSKMRRGEQGAELFLLPFLLVTHSTPGTGLQEPGPQGFALSTPRGRGKEEGPRQN